MDQLSQIEVSGFRNVHDKDPKRVNLMKWIKGYRKLDPIVDQIRQEPDKNKRSELKKQLPGITPSGLFEGGRKAENLQKHSGLIALDFDQINPDQVKKTLAGISNILYAGMSVSGQGVWALILVRYPEHHRRHCEALEADFKHLGLIIDPSCKDVSRLRFYSYDKDPVFNPDAITYHKLAPEKANKPRPRQNGNPAALERLIRKIEAKEKDITEGYKNWLKIGGALAAEYDEKGRDMFHRISQFHTEYSEQATDKQYDGCLRNKVGLTENMIFDIARQHGILLKNEADSDMLSEDKPPKHLTLKEHRPLVKKLANKTANKPWDIAELEGFFAGVNIPTKPIQITPGELITDPTKFIESHLDIVRAQNGKTVYKPYLKRLHELREYLKKNKN